MPIFSVSTTPLIITAVRQLRITRRMQITPGMPIPAQEEVLPDREVMEDQVFRNSRTWPGMEGR